MHMVCIATRASSASIGPKNEKIAPRNPGLSRCSADRDAIRGVNLWAVGRIYRHTSCSGLTELFNQRAIEPPTAAPWLLTFLLEKPGQGRTSRFFPTRAQAIMTFIQECSAYFDATCGTPAR